MKRTATILLLASMAFSGCQTQVPSQSSVQTGVPPTQQNLPGETMQTAGQSGNEQGMYVVFYQGALADVSLRYADAQVYTTALLTVDPAKVSREEWLKFADTTNTKWEEARQAAGRFDEIVALFPDRELSLNVRGGFLPSWFRVPVAFAQNEIPIEIPDREVQKSLDEAGQIQPKGLIESDRGEEVQVLNEGITEVIDKVPPKKMLEAAAKIFNTDIQGAYTKLQELRGKISDEHYQWAQVYNDLSATAEDIKLASEVALFVGGLATGGSELAVFGSAGKLKNAYNLISTAISGADLTFSLTEKGVQLDLISEETGKRMSDAADADFFKYLKVWSSIKDINKAISDYKDVYTSYKEGKETLRKLKEIGGEAVDEAELAKQAFKNLMMSGDKYKEIIQGGIGNVQTSYDLGGKVLDFLSANPDATSVSLQMQSDGTVTVQAGGNEQVRLNDQGVPIGDLQDNQKLQEMSGLIRQLYSGTQPGAGISDSEVQLVVPAGQQATQPAPTDQPLTVQPPVVPPVVPPPAVVQPPLEPVVPPQVLIQPDPVVEKPVYDGTYSGSSTAAVGVASGSLTVTGGALSGRVTYRESIQGQSFSIGLNVSGSVNDDGKVSGRFSGSQKSGGSTVTVSGSFSGGIYDNVMSLRFSGSSSATGGVSGSISLYR